jgi:hypothetical protein
MRQPLPRTKRVDSEAPMTLQTRRCGDEELLGAWGPLNATLAGNFEGSR